MKITKTKHQDGSISITCEGDRDECLEFISARDLERNHGKANFTAFPEAFQCVYSSAEIYPYGMILNMGDGLFGRVNYGDRIVVMPSDSACRLFNTNKQAQ